MFAQENNCYEKYISYLCLKFHIFLSINFDVPTYLLIYRDKHLWRPEKKMTKKWPHYPIFTCVQNLITPPFPLYFVDVRRPLCDTHPLPQPAFFASIPIWWTFLQILSRALEYEVIFTGINNNLTRIRQIFQINNNIVHFVSENTGRENIFGFCRICNISTTWKVSVFGVFLVCIFPHSDWIRRNTPYHSVSSPNAGKYGPEKLRIRKLHTQCKTNNFCQLNN